MAVAGGETSSETRSLNRSLWYALFKSLIVPILLLGFFSVAPHWLSYRVRNNIIESINASNLPEEEKTRRVLIFQKLDLEEVCLDTPVGMETLRDRLDEDGLCGQYLRLRWGFYFSLLLAGVLGTTTIALIQLNRAAQTSPEALLRNFQLSWKLALSVALIKVFLLIPLLAYGFFEFTVLLSDHYFPKLLICIVGGGLYALWKSTSILLKKVPLEFEEPMSREITPEEAPLLWQVVRQAAARLQTNPPDRIVVGMQLNFYVTELAVIQSTGRVEGRTLFLSYPLLKHLSPDEVVAIIGHELGHFIGEDTRMTREFYPLRFKIHQVMVTLAQSGWACLSSFQFLDFFTGCFEKTVQSSSRTRELLADQKAAQLTSSRTIARALVKLQVLVEAFDRGVIEAVRKQVPNPLDVPLRTIIGEHLMPETKFWSKLFEEKQAHPLDSHPPLQVRLDGLGETIQVCDAQAMALEETESAYARWFPNHEGLFTELTQQAAVVAQKVSTQRVLKEADYQSQEGRDLLDQHFPLVEWKNKKTIFHTILIVIGILFGLSGLVAWAYDSAFITLAGIFAVIGIIVSGLGWWGAVRHVELTLTPEWVLYSGWKKPVRFTDVASMALGGNSSSPILAITLKESQPPISRFTFLPFGKRSTVSLFLSGYTEKPDVIANTIHRYFTRQIS